jgi:hypothetical protein
VRPRSTVVAVLLFLLLPVGTAHALTFGEDDKIHAIQDVDLKGAKGEALYLGHMVKTQFFGAGIYVTDGGYVLGVKGDSHTFYPMPKGEQLAKFQESGLLPNPLPPYSLNFFDYLFGYSLWIVLVVVIGWVVIGDRLKKRKAVAASPPAA